MKIHPEELKMIDLFRKNILSEFTIQEIMKKINKKSYNWAYNALKKLSKSIIFQKKIGKAYLSRINLESPESILYLSYLDKKEAFESNIPLIKEIIESISIKTPFFTLLVAGSYAKKTARKDSDIDIVIIVDEEEKKKEIMPYVNEATRLSETETDIHIFSKQQFLQMLLEDDENFGKEAFRKHILFYGAEAYYQIVKEAIKNGLQNKI